VRHKAKLIIFSALSAALTVAGLSVAAGGSGGGSSSGSSGTTNGERVDRHFGPPGGPPGMAIDQDVADVLRQIHEAVEKKAPEIADPIIQKAQDAGDITSDQADKLRAAAQAIADGKRPDASVHQLLRDSDVRKVVRDAFAAAAKQAPDIAEPILDKAVADKKITSAQADKIRERLKNPPPFRGGPGFGHRGPGIGPGGPPGFGPGGRHGLGPIDQDVATVLGDIHAAVEGREAEIAEPIIKKAVDDGKITQAQADAIRNRRPGRFDQDVAKVLDDIHAAVAKEALALAEPILDKAVAEKKITSAQAQKIRTMLENKPRFRGGPPPPFRGGHRGPDWGGRGPSQRGNVPGAFPGGAAPDQMPAAVPGQPA
jgi:hypothetical protein